MLFDDPDPWRRAALLDVSTDEADSAPPAWRTEFLPTVAAQRLQGLLELCLSRVKALPCPRAQTKFVSDVIGGVICRSLTERVQKMLEQVGGL